MSGPVRLILCHEVSDSLSPMKPLCLSGFHLLCDSDEFLISQDEDGEKLVRGEIQCEREKDAKRVHIGICFVTHNFPWLLCVSCDFYLL